MPISQLGSMLSSITVYPSSVTFTWALRVVKSSGQRTIPTATASYRTGSGSGFPLTSDVSVAWYDMTNFGTAAGLEYVAQKNAGLLFSEDTREAFQAFLEKRSPEFKGE